MNSASRHSLYIYRIKGKQAREINLLPKHIPKCYIIKTKTSKYHIRLKMCYV